MAPGSHIQLSIVVPVHNDASGLRQLLASLSPLKITAQLVVVDDGSTPPLRDTFHDAPPLEGVETLWLRCEPDAQGAGRGAGAARNLGQAAATGSHVLFLDADDTVFPALATLVRSLSGQAFDVCVFAHTDSRRSARGLQGPDEALDRAVWADVAPSLDPRPLTQDEARTLCRISNYPWNKIWRRAFLEEAWVRCTEILLHNDIEPHWAAFVSAQRILASGAICVLHNVAQSSGQLSNRRDATRLRLFEALDAVLVRFAHEAKQNPDSAAFIGTFVDFSLRLCDWVESILTDSEHISELKQRRISFLETVASLPWPVAAAMERALIDEPALAARILHVLGPS